MPFDFEQVGSSFGEQSKSPADLDFEGIGASFGEGLKTPVAGPVGRPIPTSAQESQRIEDLGEDVFSETYKGSTPTPEEELIGGTIKAVPRVAGAVAGGLALLPGAGIRAGIELLPKISTDPDKLIDWGSIEKSGEIFNEIMSVPGKLITTEEEAKAVENLGLAMKPIEMAGEGWKLIGRAADEGLQKLGLEPTYIEPLFALYGEASAIFAVPGVIKKLKSSNAFRRLTVPERALVAQEIARWNSGGMSEAEILRKLGPESKLWKEKLETLGKQPPEAPPAKPPITPEPPIKPTPPETKIAKEVKGVIDTERKPSPLSSLAKKEAEINKLTDLSDNPSVVKSGQGDAVNRVLIEKMAESEGLTPEKVDIPEAVAGIVEAPEEILAATPAPELTPESKPLTDVPETDFGETATERGAKAGEVDKFNTALAKATKLHKSSYGLKPKNSLQRLLEARQILDDIGYDKKRELYTENERLIVNYKKNLGIIEAEEAPTETKEAWEMGLLEYGKSQLSPEMASKMKGAKQVASFSAQHIKEIKSAIDRGESVPESVLSEYKGTAWADKALEAETPTEGERAKEGKQKKDTVELFSGVPFHKFGKEIVKPLEDLYIKHIGDPLWDYLSETLPEKAGKKFELIDRINKGLIFDYRKDPAFIELRDDTNFKIQQLREKAKELAKNMAKFSRPEQVRLAQIIRGSITAAPKRYADAFEVAKQFKQLEKDLQALGILGPDNKWRQLTKKEINNKFNEIKEIDKKIDKLKTRLEPIIRKNRTIRRVSEDISEEIISRTETSTEGVYETTVSKMTEANEQRIKEALAMRGFSEGEAKTMLERVKESVAPLENQKGTLKEVREKVEKVVTKSIIQEVESLKTFHPSMMARAKGSLIKDIKKQVQKRNEILNRIKRHYKMSGKQYLTRAFESIEKDNKFLNAFSRLVKPRLKKGYNIQRKDLSLEYRRFLGEIEQAPFLAFKGLANETHDREMMRMFVEISQNKDWAISPEEWLNIQSLKSRQHLIPKYEKFKPLPVTDKLGPLSGALIDPYIWDDLNQAVAVRSDMIKAYDALLSLWKTGKVVYNPAAQARNILSNTILADFGGLSPHRIDIYAKAAKDMLSKSGYWAEAKTTPLLGTEWAGAEITQFLKESSELKEGNFLTKSSGPIRSLLDLPGKSYQGIEQFFKLAVFINERKNGKTIKQSAKQAEKSLFNYQKIPPAIRWAKRWYSPFITFSYKAIPRFAETVIKKPWKIAKYAALMLAVEEITRRMYGESKEEVEREQRVLPDYMRKTILPGQLSHLRVPIKDKYGRSKYLDLSFILPWGDVAEQWGQSHLVGRPLLPNHPLFVTVAEIAFNEILFTGEELTAKGVDEGSDYFKALGVQIWRQALPSLAGSYSFNKLMTAYKGERDWAGRDRSLTEAIFDVFLGLKLRSIDYNESHARRIRGLQGRIKIIKDRFSDDYNRIVFRNTTPDMERDNVRIKKLYTKMNKQLDKIMDKITEVEQGPKRKISKKSSGILTQPKGQGLLGLIK